MALVPAMLYAHLEGPDPRHTAAPGDKPLACADADMCHTSNPATGGPINFYSGYGVTAAFSSGSIYTPGGDPITITVNVTDPVNTYFGFQMTARLDSDLVGGQAGDFTAGAHQFVQCDDGSLKLTKGCPAQFPVQFIQHTFPKNTQAQTTPYTFTWTPPATNVGPVHFYVAGNAVDNNNDQADGGDHVYTNSYVLTPYVPFTCTNTTKPVITSAQFASGFGGGTNFTPGTWLEIKGTNLASTTRQWQGYDFTGVNAPTSLDGVSVSVNGENGFIYYVNSDLTQVNVQAPAGTSTEVVPVTVTNCNATSDPFTVLKEATLVPGMLAPSSFLIGGKQYLVALFLDGFTYVGNIPGVTSRPAKPGETIVTYGIGFGDTSPSFAPGIVVGAGNQLTNPLTIKFGTTQAQTTYFGLAPGQVGVYQFNITVPNVANGDFPISITVGGVKAIPSSMYLTVHN